MDAAAGENRVAELAALTGAAELGIWAAGDDCGRSAARAGTPGRFAAARSLPFDGGFDCVTAAYPHLQVA